MNDPTTDAGERMRASRRNVVRGAAWSAPAVAVATAAPAFAASPCSTYFSYVLNWGTTSYTRTDFRNGSASVTAAGATPLTVTFASVSSSSGNQPDTARNLTVPPNTGTSTTIDPVVSSLGGRSGERGVMFNHSSSTVGRDNRQDITITFSRAVRGLKFWLTDIDAITNPAYSDRVELVGSNANGNVVTFTSANDGITGAGSQADPWLRSSNQNVNENSAGAQTFVDFTKSSPTSSTDVKRMVVTYWNATGGSQYHRVFMGDLTFTALGC